MELFLALTIRACIYSTYQLSLIQMLHFNNAIRFHINIIKGKYRAGMMS